MSSIYNALIEIVGVDYASNRQEELFTYSKDLGTSEPKWPEYVVLPKTVEELQKVVLYANQEKVPIVPLGGGLSLAGIALPQRGGIVVDMKRMDRILEINEKARYAVVEAGTAQGKLAAHLTKNYPQLMHSIPDAPPAATVGGNVAIHGQGDLAHPHGFNTDMVLGLEVVMPTGEICRFGSCSVGSGWFTQHPLPDMAFFFGWGGATGIITKISIKLYPSKKYKEAEALYLRCLKIDEAALGKNHRHLTPTLDNLAQLYIAMEKHEQAKIYRERSRKIKQAPHATTK